MVLGALGVWLGFPLADPIVGLVITAMIFGIVWQSAKAVFTRILDGVDPHVTAELRHAAEHVPGIAAIDGVRARWVGHRLPLKPTSWSMPSCRCAMQRGLPEVCAEAQLTAGSIMAPGRDQGVTRGRRGPGATVERAPSPLIANRPPERRRGSVQSGLTRRRADPSSWQFDLGRR